jgi:hypothetical protein
LRFSGSILDADLRAAGLAAFFFFAGFADLAAALGLAVIRADFLLGFVFFFAAFAMSKVSLITDAGLL